MKIQYFSEDLNRYFDTEEALNEAESAHKAEVAKAEALVQERKSRAKEVEDAYAEVQAAEKHYIELRNKFIKDYKSYHMTYSAIEDFVDDIFDSVIKIF